MECFNTVVGRRGVDSFGVWASTTCSASSGLHLPHAGDQGAPSSALAEPAPQAPSSLTGLLDYIPVLFGGAGPAIDDSGSEGSDLSEVVYAIPGASSASSAPSACVSAPGAGNKREVARSKSTKVSAG